MKIKETARCCRCNKPFALFDLVIRGQALFCSERCEQRDFRDRLANSISTRFIFLDVWGYSTPHQTEAMWKEDRQRLLQDIDKLREFVEAASPEHRGPEEP